MTEMNIKIVINDKKDLSNVFNALDRIPEFLECNFIKIGMAFDNGDIINYELVEKSKIIHGEIK